MNKYSAFLIRLSLFPLMPVFWALELALTPPKCRIGPKGWLRLWLTGCLIVFGPIFVLYGIAAFLDWVVSLFSRTDA